MEALINQASRFWLPDIWDCNPANRAGSYFMGSRDGIWLDIYNIVSEVDKASSDKKILRSFENSR